MMSSSREMPAVLCIGDDRRLLETRCSVVRTLFANVTMSSSDEVPELTSERFDLVVLCHSINPEQYQFCVAFIRERWKDAQIVLVSRNYSSRGQPEQTVSAQPALLLQELRQIAGALPT